MHAGVADDDQKRNCESNLSNAKVILDFGIVEKAHGNRVKRLFNQIVSNIMNEDNEEVGSISL